MTEEIIKSWIPRFRKGLNLGEGFEEVYKQILQSDKEMIDTEYSSYPAGIAYITCLLIGEKRTQEQIAKLAECSKISLRKRYKAIVKRNELYLPE
jgi:transcription initiation factor TFIIIB Brf1 subunit/transcription initiation factor TFIIB